MSAAIFDVWKWYEICLCRSNSFVCHRHTWTHFSPNKYLLGHPISQQQFQAWNYNSKWQSSLTDCWKKCPKWDKPSIKSIFLHRTILLWINTDASKLSCCPLHTSQFTDWFILAWQQEFRDPYPFARLSSSSSGRLFPRRSLSLR